MAQDSRGAQLIEYVLALFAIAVAALGAFVVLGDEVDQRVRCAADGVAAIATGSPSGACGVAARPRWDPAPSLSGDIAAASGAAEAARSAGSDAIVDPVGSTIASLRGDDGPSLFQPGEILEATARKLLATRQNCSELLAELATVDSVRLRDTLHQHHSQILRTEQLATLRDDAPISAADPLWAAPSASALRALATLFEELEFKSLLTRLESLLARHASCS